jgi:hypothetical protein
MLQVTSFLPPIVPGQPRDERLSNTENGRAIALRCDAWLASLSEGLIQHLRVSDYELPVWQLLELDD